MGTNCRKRVWRTASGERGFTLVELMTVIVLISILVTLAVPVFTSATAAASLRTAQANHRIGCGIIERLYMDFAAGGHDLYTDPDTGAPIDAAYMRVIEPKVPWVDPDDVFGSVMGPYMEPLFNPIPGLDFSEYFDEDGNLIDHLEFFEDVCDALGWDQAEFTDQGDDWFDAFVAAIQAYHHEIMLEVMDGLKGAISDWSNFRDHFAHRVLIQIEPEDCYEGEPDDDAAFITVGSLTNYGHGMLTAYHRGQVYCEMRFDWPPFDVDNMFED